METGGCAQGAQAPKIEQVKDKIKKREEELADLGKEIAEAKRDGKGEMEMVLQRQLVAVHQQLGGLQQQVAELWKQQNLLLQIELAARDKEALKQSAGETQGGLQYFISPQAQSKVESSVFYILDDADEGLGIGVFVSDRQAVTCDHHLTAEHSVGSSVNVSIPVKMSNLSLRVARRDPDLNYAILESQEPQSFIEPWQGDIVQLRGTELVLASFRIGIEEGAPLFSRRLGFAKAAALSVSEHSRFLMYCCPPFSGESGAALVVQAGYLVGIHQLVANQVRETVERKKIMDQRLSDIESSLNKLVGGGTSQACCALLWPAFVGP